MIFIPLSTFHVMRRRLIGDVDAPGKNVSSRGNSADVDPDAVRDVNRIIAGRRAGVVHRNSARIECDARAVRNVRTASRVRWRTGGARPASNCLADGGLRTGWWIGLRAEPQRDPRGESRGAVGSIDHP